MINFEKELERILDEDPLGLLDVKPRRPTTMTTDERLIAAFNEITTFVKEKGREPTESRDINERKLFSRLKSLRESPARAAALLEFDEIELLADVEIPQEKEIKTINDVLDEDPLGLLDEGNANESDDPEDIFTLRNVPKTTRAPDYVAKRKACKEFDQFEPLFKLCHSELTTGERVQVKFKSESQIRPEAMLVFNGMLCYVAGIGVKTKNKSKVDYEERLLLVFENGTESNMLKRSLSSALWKDETSREVISSDQLELFNKASKVNPDDKASGCIYVLRSLSEDTRIAEIQDLYKIGFSNQPVEDRISNSAKEPTFLMADVVPVVEFQTYNLNPQKLELLTHRFFAAACLNLEVFDGDGQKHTPREWFIVPLHIIEMAIELLINGEIVNYRYDEKTQQICERDSE